ncbi:tripartite motif-containing protein 16-like [Polypterus senegalus]|uniref:tripartite motif-containing protein 16-like n=1 Tax=Polypterus senegalus TaxID=55291 RepID=UPI00196388AF|nr:tripartite motif-containing protein 16-like [Polypterus senegalus]
MAAPQLSVSVDRYSCSVCREVLTEPVTIPCGHSYCMRCINDFWDQSDKEDTYNCPQCWRTFNVRPEINRNTVLTEIIEKLKEVRVDASLSQSCAGQDDVPCDVCPVINRRAVKTCMTCMISYCETHLQPHKEHGAYKRHQLEEPTGHLEEKLCAKHQEVLKLFCRTDECCVCLLCLVTEHKSHDTVMLEEERAQRQSQLENKKDEEMKKIEENERKLEEMEKIVVRIQSSAETKVQEQEKTFKSVLESIERLGSEVTEVIRAYEEKEVRKAQGVIQHLKKEREELKRRDNELNDLLHTDDHIHFIKKFPSLCVSPGGGVAHKITNNEDFLPETLKTNLSNLKRSLEETAGWQFVETTEADVGGSGQTLRNLRNRNGLLRYSCLLTLDPNTKNNWLQLSEKNKMVTHLEMLTSSPDYPDRFNHWQQVLCREALRGTRYYWEVECTGKWFGIGVTYKGIDRKGKNLEYCLGCTNRSWCLFCCDFSFSFWHNNKSTKIRASSSNQIGVYLDCPAGSLSFYCVSTMTLLHKFTTVFTEPLYPGFWVGTDSHLTISPPSTSDQ